MKKIVIFNQKGGVGKTATTINLAGCLDECFKKKVLVVDCDSQINATNYLLTQEEIEVNRNLVDFLKGKRVWADDILRINLFQRKPVKTNIYLIPGSREIDLVQIKEISIIKDILTELENEYDYCLFDCPPHISDMTISALAFADYVIVPALADTDSLCGYDLLLDTVNQIRESGTNIELKVLGIFFNNVESNKALEKFIINDCKENMSDTILKTSIRRASIVPQARYYGKPVVYFKPSSPVASDYKQLTKEIMKKIGDK